MTERYAHATNEGKRKAVEAVQSVPRSTRFENDYHKFATEVDDEQIRKSVSH